MDLPERTRIQPSLTPHQMELLRAIRARKGWSVSVAVGEAVEAYAQELGLVDHLQTSHAYLLDRIQEADLYKIEFIAPTSIRDRISQWASIFSKNFA